MPTSLGELDGIWVEPLACVLRAAELVPRGRVHVVGCGAIGLLWAQVLLRRGDEVVGRRSARRARRAARSSSVPRDAPGGRRGRLTAHAGMDSALADARSRRDAARLLARRRLATSLDAVYRRELRVVGSRSAAPAQFDAAIDSCPRSSLPPVEVLPLERFADGLERYRSGAALKVAFVP